VVQAIPKIGGTKDVNIEKIRRLAPTHLIVNIDENEKPTVDLLAEFIPHVIVTHPNTRVTTSRYIVTRRDFSG
jgi:ABC-type Fe3+-hydroxamate transport system substrate-binding protein